MDISEKSFLPGEVEGARSLKNSETNSQGMFFVIISCQRVLKVLHSVPSFRSAVSKASHKQRVRTRKPLEMAEVLQKPVFAVLGGQQTCVNTYLCDRFGVAGDASPPLLKP